MKIYDNNQQPVSTSTVQGRETNRVDTAQTRESLVSGAHRGQKADEVHLSGVGAQLSAPIDSGDREARISEIAAVYRAGSYKVDAEKVSDRLIDDATITR
jgi:anti-sigma28 factor (negative regulator of flagellin synthesis)